MGERPQRRTLADLPTLLRDARFMRQLSARDAAKRIGISASSLVRIESGADHGQAIHPQARTMPTMNEKEMREATVPTPKTTEELAAYITTLVDQPHDYGTCVYAMSMAATAAFNYVASKLGVTGFQASCADMDILSRTRGYKHGFMILNAEDLLYPQYDLRQRVDEWITKTEPQLADAAKQRLASSGSSMHPNVRAHMEQIASLPPVSEDDAR